MTDTSTALAVTHENHHLPAALQATPVLSATVVLDRANLQFMANMIEGANLVPYDKNTSREVQKARVMAKIVAGVAHNFDPVSAQENFHIIQNRCVLSARGMAIKLRRLGRYDTRIKQLDDDGCILEVLERKGDELRMIGQVAFMKTDAQKGGLLASNSAMYEKWGKDMFFANAMKRVVRRFAPEALDTTPVLYDTAARPAPPMPAPAQTPNALGNGQQPSPTHQPQEAPNGAPAPSQPPVAASEPHPGDAYEDPSYSEEDVAEAVLEEEAIIDSDDGFTPAGSEPIDAEPVDPSESSTEDLRIAAKDWYSGATAAEKRKANEWLGQRTIGTLEADDLRAFFDTFCG